MSEKRMSDELAAVEAMLGSLTPAASSVDRDRLMFLAGRASAEGRSLPHRRRVYTWLWPCATAASLLVAVALGLLRGTGGKPEIVERVVYVSPKSSTATFDIPPVAQSVSSPWLLENRRLLQLVLEKGIDALPQSNVSFKFEGPPARRGESDRNLLNQLLTDPTS